MDHRQPGFSRKPSHLFEGLDRKGHCKQATAYMTAYGVYNFYIDSKNRNTPGSDGSGGKL